MLEQINISPVDVDRTLRGVEVTHLSSNRAGKIIPVHASNLHRMDRVSRGSINLRLHMAETVHPLMNAVGVTAYVHFVPFSAFERFGGSMDILNRSYAGEPNHGTSTVTPFFTSMNFDRTAPFWRALGVHEKDGSPVNAAYVEAYNTLVNFRRQARSTKLPVRALLDTTLAEAFWRNPVLADIVPDFDQAMMDGEAEVTLNGRAPVVGLGIADDAGTVAAASTRTALWSNTTVNATSDKVARRAANALFETVGGIPQVFAELTNLVGTVSLANIELAKQVASFAKLRQSYAGMTDDHLIDLLVEGIEIPPEAARQPILLDRKSTVFGYSERHATDGANLDKSVTTGVTALNLSFRTPPMNAGGVLLVTLEIVPEPLFERMADPFLQALAVSDLPNFKNDFLDPDKVDVVQNREIDVEHANPTGTFGYRGLNAKWNTSLKRIGGKFYRPLVNSFVENRQRFWSVEQVNPALTTDFYLVRDLPHTVFADAEEDPFEILATGSVAILGNTVFGKRLEEDTGDYAAILEGVDTSRVVQP